MLYEPEMPPPGGNFRDFQTAKQVEDRGPGADRAWPLFFQGFLACKELSKCQE